VKWEAKLQDISEMIVKMEGGRNWLWSMSNGRHSVLAVLNLQVLLSRDSIA
jgi:hypothetical protein